MSKEQENTRKNKHLNKDDRRQIETLLNEGHSFRYIAERLDRPVSTISREVSRHTKVIQPTGCEDCMNYHCCNKKQVCQYGRNKGCRKQCKKCVGARKNCSDLVQGYCQKLTDDRTGVCNFCRNKSGHICSYERHLYVSSEAHTAYKDDWSEKRAGFDLTDEQITHISDIVTPLIRKGQSPYHIIQTHGRELGISEATLRRLVGSSRLEARNIDLRCLVKMKPRRKSTNNGYRVMVVVKDGHKWDDFQRFIEDTGSPYAEMDCVEGAKDSHSVLLTLLFPVSSLQEAILMREHDTIHVVDTLDMLEEVLGDELFHECFPVILTDNGHEFADLYRIEHGPDGHERTKVFYCEPNRSDQKGHCENNHKYIRYVIPKGTNMDGLCQSDISLMMDHVNSY